MKFPPNARRAAYEDRTNLDSSMAALGEALGAGSPIDPFDAILRNFSYTEPPFSPVAMSSAMRPAAESYAETSQNPFDAGAQDLIYLLLSGLHAQRLSRPKGAMGDSRMSEAIHEALAATPPESDDWAVSLSEALTDSLSRKWIPPHGR